MIRILVEDELSGKPQLGQMMRENCEDQQKELLIEYSGDEVVLDAPDSAGDGGKGIKVGSRFMSRQLSQIGRY